MPEIQMSPMVKSERQNQSSADFKASMRHSMTNNQDQDQERGQDMLKDDDEHSLSFNKDTMEQSRDLQDEDPMDEPQTAPADFDKIINLEQS